MKIKAKRSFAGVGFSAASGAVITVPDAIAQDLIRANYAEEMTDGNLGNNESNNSKPTKRRTKRTE